MTFQCQNMNGKSGKIPRNYSVKNIIDCILKDNRKACSYTTARKKKLFDQRVALLENYPDLQKILTIKHIRGYPFKGAHFFARIAVLPPEIVIVDQRIKDLCTLPYWTIYKDKKGSAYRAFGKCPGYGWLPGCPPRSPSVQDVQKMLDQSHVLIVLQTKLQSERWDTRWKFRVLHRLAKDIEQVLGKRSVTGLYGSGPCGACTAQTCLHNQPCKSPHLKIISLESMGICVDRMCSDLALLTQQNSWQLNWVKHFGLPQQHPKRWKYVVALSVKL